MIPLVTWIVWALIGIVAGYMCSRLLLDGCRSVVCSVAGICGALLGGWSFMTLADPAPGVAFERMEIVSLVVALCCSALVLWPTVVLLRRQ